MLHLKDGLSLKSQLTVFSALVLHHTVVFLLLTHSCGGQSQVIGPSQPIVAIVGDEMILPCRLEPATDAVAMTLEWARPDLNPRFVHLWRDGRELLINKNPSYMGRTSLFIDKLKHGDISLKLSNVKLSDEGKYRCFIPSLGRESIVKIVVGAVSSPVIGITKNSSEVVLGCESKGWYPEPEVFWLDGEGNILSAGPTETVRGPDGLYTVSSRVTVEKTHTNRFTCRVQQQNINQTRETHIHVPDEFFMVPSSSAVYISIVLAVVFMCIVAVVFVVWRWRRNKIKTKKNHEDETEQREGEKKTKPSNNTELQVLMDGERDGEKPMAEREAMKDLVEGEGENKSKSKSNHIELQFDEEQIKRNQRMTEIQKMKKLKKEMGKLQEEREKKENEQKHAEEVVTRLMGQKKGLENQRERLQLQLEEVERQRDENERKIQSVDREITERERDKADLKIQKEAAEKDKDEDKKLLLEAKMGLDKRKAELEKELQKTEKTLESKEGEITKMIQRKSKAESQKEKINVKFEEIEKQRDDIKRKLESE
ncbi:butyrophilin subfamily 3 member A2-like [Centroberyx affinis]|uniref:butyrophilin subfamily 3 member A2-like n=1 Tax=Centroberyx affinis TaxID=166261 RepID=UPI003A5BB3F4